MATDATDAPGTRRPSTPLRLFLGLLIAYAVWDWWEHISRPGSWFAAQPGLWFGFTFVATAAIVGVILGVRAVVVRLTRRTGLVAEALAVAAGPIVHVYLTGPLAGELFPVEGHLTFHTPWPLVGIFVIGLVALYGGTALVRRVAGAGP